MNDSKVAIKGFDIIRHLIISISIEYLRQFSIQHLPRLINMEVKLQRVEVSCRDNNF